MSAEGRPVRPPAEDARPPLGMTPQEIVDDYPDLELADIHAVLAFAARLSRIRHIEPLAA